MVLMRLFTYLLTLFLMSCAHSAVARCPKGPVIIAVIDTGFGYQDRGHEARLCRFGHKDFTIDRQFTKNYVTKDMVPVDFHGHGTNVAGIIDGYAKNTSNNYCIVVIKYYSFNQAEFQNVAASIRAFRYAIDIGVDVINYSGGGSEPHKVERDLVEEFLNKGGKLVAAAGNEKLNLDKYDFYPALYDERIVVVGNRSLSGERVASSNYGNKVNRWEIGEEVTAYGITLTGTSQATAVASGKIVSETMNKCDRGF